MPCTSCHHKLQSMEPVLQSRLRHQEAFQEQVVRKTHWNNKNLILPFQYDTNMEYLVYIKQVSSGWSGKPWYKPTWWKKYFVGKRLHLTKMNRNCCSIASNLCFTHKLKDFSSPHCHEIITVISISVLITQSIYNGIRTKTQERIMWHWWIL